MKLKCEDCNWVGFQEECKVSFEPVPFTEGDVEPYLVCLNCQSSHLVPLGDEVQQDT